MRDLENPALAKNGDRRWINTSGLPLLDDEGHLMGCRGSNTDNTERKRMEEQDRASEANFRAFFAAMRDMVIVGTQAGRVFYPRRAPARETTEVASMPSCQAR